MKTIPHSTTLLPLLVLALLLSGATGPVQGEAGHPTVINVYLEGPHPQKLTVAAGTAVLWVSHLTHTKFAVVTVTFAEGHMVAQATGPVEGYNSFVLAGHDFTGRMQGDGGTVALRFVAPGAYTYALDHGHFTGTIVVR